MQQAQLFGGRTMGPVALALLCLALALAACSKKPRDLDLMVWSRPGWDPIQEQVDYAECYEHGRKAAYRKFHWRRTNLSKEVESDKPTMNPATIAYELNQIKAHEKAATLDIAEECMNGRGYELRLVNKAER